MWRPAQLPHMLVTGGTGTGKKKTSIAHSLLNKISVAILISGWENDVAASSASGDWPKPRLRFAWGCSSQPAEDATLHGVPPVWPVPARLRDPLGHTDALSVQGDVVLVDPGLVDQVSLNERVQHRDDLVRNTCAKPRGHRGSSLLLDRGENGMSFSSFNADFVDRCLDVVLGANVSVRPAFCRYWRMFGLVHWTRQLEKPPLES